MIDRCNDFLSGDVKWAGIAVAVRVFCRRIFWLVERHAEDGRQKEDVATARGRVIAGSQQFRSAFERFAAGVYVSVMVEILGYAAMLTGIIAAVTVSADFGRKITGYAFIVFAFSSILWIFVALIDTDKPLLIQNIVLTIVNLFGVYRWLIREAP